MRAQSPVRPPLELWGGFECTVVRIGEAVRDEILETGHRDRIEDLDALAALGIRTVRYPVLWETISPDGPDTADWGWHDARLGRLRDLGIRVIAGLVHHGSGPRWTGLLDPAFPAKLARHAARVARRYPWIEDFTPVNEPLTTARFSALYGHWHPHARSEAEFLRATVIECRATVEAMRAIRRITPSARLIQTEDLGRTHARRRLAGQADYENERRWLSLDLLTGRVDRHHPFAHDLARAGVSDADLGVLRTAEGTPDILGINHYLTSERYLDERLDLYGPEFHGGNGRQAYADVEAVRIRLPDATLGPRARLKEAWERYRLPTAITEAHHGCTRDEQLRWLDEVWQAAKGLRDEGADIRAVTLWSMLGAVDWNSLLTRNTGFYEPGAFDVRSGTPRPTALAAAAASYARTGAFSHPVLDVPGWWRRPGRHYRRQRGLPRTGLDARSILITGSGRLARAFSRICTHRGLTHVMLGRGQLDPTDPRMLAEAFDAVRPWAVIHCAGFSDIRRAETERLRCFRENVASTEAVALACAERGIPLIAPSSDRVFDGRRDRPYVESDPVSPADAFGRSKAEAEKRLAALGADALIVRTGPLFSPWSERDFLNRAVLHLAGGGRIAASGTDRISPTYAPDLVHAALDLMIDGASGVWHLANPGSATAFDLLDRSVRAFGTDGAGLVHRHDDDAVNRVLESERAALLPPLESAIARYHQEARGLLPSVGSVRAAE